ncbi:MAG: hypothetical protein M0T84_13820 [Betaproteobacteria bacterium]|nr:hypothetical protein [Betaproteobacteria bacterium]
MSPLYRVLPKVKGVGGIDRFTTAYCISSTANDTGNCSANRLVHAGVSFIPFNGGNMPMQAILGSAHETEEIVR